VRFVDEKFCGNRTLSHFILFSLMFLLLAGCSSAQCGNCDDNNPCTRDWCNGTQCLHEPQICDQSGTLEKPRQETIDVGGPVGFPPAIAEDDKSTSTIDASINPISIAVPEPTVSCDDGNPCTRDYGGDEGCRHESISCDDGDSNTIDTCGPSGCINTPAPASEENPNRQSILLDLQIINETDVVDGRSDTKCDDCDDGNACTADNCDPATGCSHVALDCNDNDACTSDSCDPATGCGHAALDCNDNDACTSDSCDPITGCNNEPMTCDDGNESTMDYCQGGECIYQPIESKKSDDDRSGIDQVTKNLNGSSLNNTTALSEAIQSEHFDRHRCRSNMDCSDGNSSTNDYCNNGTCYHTPQICSDGNNCTIDSFNGVDCVYTPLRCNDGNVCTDDRCVNGKCVNTPRVCNDGDPCTEDKCDRQRGCYYPNKCDDGDACTIDACVNGNCTHTRKVCNDGDPCTIDRCDRGRCYYQSRCDDGDPCTIDRCDRRGHCTHSPVVCRDGKTCIQGTCQYLYYPYYPYYLYDVPYVPTTPTAPAPATAKPQSYTIPAGTSITLPWGGSMLSAEILQVYNGLAYPAATPISFTRNLGSPAQIASIGQVALSATINQWEMIGLSWKDAGFKMTLIQPNKTVLPAQGDGRNVVHLTGSNYDYYFLKSPPAGNWTVQIVPVNAASSGTGYSLISGLVQGAIPPNQA